MELEIKKTETRQDINVQVSESVTASVSTIRTNGEITTVDADFYTTAEDGSNNYIGHINWNKGKVSLYGFELNEATTEMLNTFREIFTEVTATENKENIVN